MFFPFLGSFFTKWPYLLKYELVPHFWPKLAKIGFVGSLAGKLKFECIKIKINIENWPNYGPVFIFSLVLGLKQP